MNLAKNFLIVSRANIQIASLPTATIGFFLAADQWKDIFNLSVYLFVILFFVALTYSCNLNCLYDVEVDEKYKKSLSDAVKSIGLSRLNTIINVELLMMGIIILLLCMSEKKIIYLLAVFGILCGYAYSAPPLRLKKRGLISPLAVMFGLYFIPLLAGWYIVSSSISPYIILFGIGYMFIMQGITFINTCEDFNEDRDSNIRTFAHIVGIKKTLFLGSLLVSLGGLIDAFLVLSKTKKQIIGTIPIIAIAIFGLLFLFSILKISKTLYILSIGANPVLQCKKKAYKMRFWFLSTRYPLLLISILLVPH